MCNIKVGLIKTLDRSGPGLTELLIACPSILQAFMDRSKCADMIRPFLDGVRERRLEVCFLLRPACGILHSRETDTM